METLINNNNIMYNDSSKNKLPPTYPSSKSNILDLNYPKIGTNNYWKDKNFTNYPSLWWYSKGYDIIIIAGQSNSVGRGQSATGPNVSAYPADVNRIIDPDIWQLKADNKTISQAQESLDSMEGGGNHGTMGFGVSFARAYKADGRLRNGRKILLINCGCGGSSFSTCVTSGCGARSWQPGKYCSNGNLYTQTINRVNAGFKLAVGDNNIVAILWHQGENDSKFVADKNHPKNGSVYQGYVHRMLSSLRTSVGAAPTTPIVLGGLVPGQNKTMTRLISEIPTKFPNEYFGYSDSTGLTSDQKAGALHFSKNSQIIFGKRYYAAYKLLLD